MTMNKEEMVSLLKAYFQQKTSAYALDMAFLYGSWAGGYPNMESDVDVAVLFRGEMPEDKAFVSDGEVEGTKRGSVTVRS